MLAVTKKATLVKRVNVSHNSLLLPSLNIFTYICTCCYLLRNLLIDFLYVHDCM